MTTLAPLLGSMALALLGPSGDCPGPAECASELITDLASGDVAARAATRAALGQLESAEGFADVARGLDRPPKPIRLTRPMYPRDAFLKRIEGTVIVEILIDRDGRVTKARVIRSVKALDESAVRTVNQWSFAPAVRDGRVVATIANAPIGFRIGGKPSDAKPAKPPENALPAAKPSPSAAEPPSVTPPPSSEGERTVPKSLSQAGADALLSPVPGSRSRPASRARKKGR